MAKFRLALHTGHKKSSAFYAIIVVLLVHVLHLFCSRGLSNMWDRAIPIKNEDAFTLVPPEPALFIAAFISLHFYQLIGTKQLRNCRRKPMRRTN